MKEVRSLLTIPEALAKAILFGLVNLDTRVASGNKSRAKAVPFFKFSTAFCTIPAFCSNSFLLINANLNHLIALDE